jgi:hypothetical protein
MWNTVKSWIGLYTPSVDEILRNVQNGQFPGKFYIVYYYYYYYDYDYDYLLLMYDDIDGDALRTAYTETENRKFEVDRDIRTIERQKQIDYGADQRFAALENQCFKMEMEE